MKMAVIAYCVTNHSFHSSEVKVEAYLCSSAPCVADYHQYTYLSMGKRNTATLLLQLQSGKVKPMFLQKLDEDIL